MSTLGLVLRALIIVVVGILSGVLGNYIFKLFDYDHSRLRWLYLRRALTAFIALLVMTIFMQWLILDEDNTAPKTVKLVIDALYSWRTTQVSMQSLLITAIISFCCGMVFYVMVERLVRMVRENRAFKQLEKFETSKRIPGSFRRKE